LRKSRVEERERALHRQRDRVRSARLEHERAAGEREAAEALGRRVQVQELQRLGLGSARVSDLGELSMWVAAQHTRVKALQQEEALAHSRLSEELSKEASLLSELSRADADAKAVERHHEDWDKERLRGVELQAEEQAADLHGSRRPEP
jgi:hypothetical protein